MLPGYVQRPQSYLRVTVLRTHFQRPPPARGLVSLDVHNLEIAELEEAVCWERLDEEISKVRVSVDERGTEHVVFDQLSYVEVTS